MNLGALAPVTAEEREFQELLMCIREYGEQPSGETQSELLAALDMFITRRVYKVLDNRVVLPSDA